MVAEKVVENYLTCKNYSFIIKGFGKTQWILLLVSGLLTMTSMGVFLSVGLIGIASQCEFDVSQSERGLMMAAPVTGK